MAKIVSSKFGNRGLVHLPPVSLSGKATPQVQTLAPAYNPRYGDGGGYTGSSSVVPKEYAYIPPAGHDTRNEWMGAPEKGYPNGNLVQSERNPHENGIGNQMFSQLLQQQSNVQGYTDYSQGYPVGPAVSGTQQDIQYTPHTISSTAPALSNQQVQGQNPQQLYQGQPGQFPQPNQQPQYGGQANPPYQPSPYEKHIYYGPDGQVMPGPPSGSNNTRSGSRSHTRLQDFSVEGNLQFGHLKSVRLLDPMKKFPVFPDYLLKDLKQKYGQFEKTWVRIISRGGEIHIHATPSIPGSQLLAGGPPQYMPVYIDEDEYYRNYYHGQSPGLSRMYGTPPPLALDDRPYGVNVPRPPTTADPIAELRWRKDDAMSEIGSVRPVERSRATFHR